MTEVRAEEIASAFVDYLTVLAVPPGLFAPDVLADFNVPHWRYQMRGADELTAQLEQDAPHGWKVSAGPVRTTPDGAVLEITFDVPQEAGHGLHYRTVWLLDVADGRISRVTLYCTGEWDDETIARHALEAPMHEL